MKSVIRVCDMNTSKDVNNIYNAISHNDGVMACEISLERKEVVVIYNNSYLKLDNIIESIELLGYVVI